MKRNLTSTNLYFIKVALFFSTTLIACYYLNPATGYFSFSAGNNFTDLAVAGIRGICSSGFHFILFTFSLFVVNPKLNQMLESALVFVILQTVFFSLTASGAINLNGYLVEMLVGIAIVCVLIDNLYSRKIRTARLGFTIAFGIVYGIWLATSFHVNGISAQHNLETIIAINAGIFITEISIVLIAFLLFGKLLTNNNKYREFVVLPMTVIAFLLIGLRAWFLYTG
jgi:hypothetical protein